MSMVSRPVTPFAGAQLHSSRHRLPPDHPLAGMQLGKAFLADDVQLAQMEEPPAVEETAASDAMMKSQARAISQPMPAATPSTATTTPASTSATPPTRG